MSSSLFHPPSALLLGRVCFMQHVDLSRCLLFVPRPVGALSSLGYFKVWASEFVLQSGLIILLQVKHSKVFTGFSLLKCRISIQIPCAHFPFIVVRLPYVMTSEFFAQEARAAGASWEMVWAQRVSRNMSSKLIQVGIVGIVTLHVTLLVSDLWIKNDTSIGGFGLKSCWNAMNMIFSNIFIFIYIFLCYLCRVGGPWFQELDSVGPWIGFPTSVWRWASRS